MSLESIKKRNAFYSEVRDKQILSALLYELTVKFASPETNLYQVLKDTANEARRRKLLVNPTEFGTYSDQVTTNVGKMRPRENGWEMIKGILYRRIYEAKRQPRWWRRQRATLSER